MSDDVLGVENINQLLESILNPLNKEDTTKVVIENNCSSKESLHNLASSTAKWIITQKNGELSTGQIQLLGVLLTYLKP